MENDRPASTTPGALVRAAREASGQSLTDLAAATRIPVAQLRALEADDHDQLSGPLYVRSFLRACAEALELDPHDLLAAYDSRNPVAAPPPVAPLWSQETEVRHAASFPWRRVALPLAALLAVGLVALAIVRFAGGGGAEGGGDGEPAAAADDADRRRRDALGDSLREAWSPLTSMAATESLPAPADSAAVDTLAARGVAADSVAWSPPDSAAAAPADSAVQAAAAAPPRVIAPSADELAVLASLPAGDQDLRFADGSRWPLVLRVVTRGRVDYAVGVDGLRNAPNVAWAARPAGLPPEGVTAGAVYPLGWRNVSYWGARDHFLLRLSAAEDVTVTLNGRPVPIPTRLVGREWVLDRSLLDR